MDDEPVVWDPAARTFVPVDEPSSPRPDPTVAQPRPEPGPSRPRRHVVIGPEHVGTGPPRRDIGEPPAAPASRGATAPPAAPPRRPSPPRPAPSPSPSRPPRARRQLPPLRKVLRIAVAVLVGFALLFVGLFFFGWWQFNRIDRVEVASALSPGGGKGTNYLVVGSDTRQGIDESSPNSGAFIAGEFGGERTDTIMVLRMEGSKSYLLSIPRDLWVTNPVTGEQGRINSVYQSGPAALITAVRELGIPVHHYLEINFVSFSKLVDAVGGITIDFPFPARDTHSGLDVPKAGKNTLNGTQALAYVRSRFYEELVDGQWRADPTADLGRVQRQRAFLQALVGKASGTKNPLTLMNLATAIGGGMRIDDELTYFDSLGLAWRLRGGFNPESLTLPVSPRTTSGGASVLDLRSAEAQPIVNQFSA